VHDEKTTPVPAGKTDADDDDDDDDEHGLTGLPE
jgi:hypothetical protein